MTNRVLNTRTVAALRVGVIVGLLFACGACSPKSSFSAAPPTPPAGRSTEQAWVIASITHDLVNLATFAADPEHWHNLPADAVQVREASSTAPGLAYTLAIELPGGGDAIRSDLKVTDTVWSPELYAPTVRTLCERLKLSPPTNGGVADGLQSDADLLRKLADADTAGMEACNTSLSAWLQAHGLDTRAHEQAALLLGSLAMRENSGLFWDPRGVCNRVVAHLAFARALHPEVSEAGEVAELLVGLILDTKADCQRRIAALQTESATRPELVPWVRAGGLRNARDYRLLPAGAPATLLERREWFRAVAEAVSPEAAIRRMPRPTPADAPDWACIVVEMEYGVDSGHRYAMPGAGWVLHDALNVLPELRNARTSETMAAVLNQPAGKAVQKGADGRARFAVIDRGTWAQFFQRHLLHTACETYEFLRHKWGVPDEAQKYQRQASAMLKDLTLYPLTVEYLGQPEGEPTQVRAADLVNRYPELVSDGGWEAVARSVPERLARGGSWQAVARAWFSPVLPTNTAYGFYVRAGGGKVLPKMTGAGVEAAHRVAPLHFGVCEAYAAALSPGGRTTAAAYEQALAPLLPYYATAMWHEAKLVKDDPSHYASLMSRAAAQDPVFHVILGRYEVDHHLDAQAAREFQSAIDQRADAVTVASISGWLANYYFDHGQKEQALAIASTAAQVYSEEGLEAMAGLLDKMGRTEEAESYFEKIRERYGNSTPLQAFYDRHAATSPEYARKMRAGQEELFPAGIHPVALAQLAGKPAHGVLVQGANDLSQRYGLQPGAIIVGLDGKRVDNMPQYMYVRGLSATPMLDLLVYQDGRYQEIHANVPGRQFGLRFVTWPEERSE